MQEGEANGKLTLYMVKNRETEDLSVQSEIYKSVSNAGSGNKVVKEKLQSKEKTLLGNGKIKTEVDM